MSRFTFAFFERTTVRYTLAVAIVIAAFVLRLELIHLFSLDLPPFILFYPAVMLAASLGSIGTGFLATAMAVVLAESMVLRAGRSQTALTASDVFGLAVFAVMGVSLSLLAEYARRSRRSLSALTEENALRRSEERLRRSLEYRQLSLEAAGLGAWEVRVASGEVLMDSHARRLYGFLPNEAITVGIFLDRVDPADRGFVRSSVEELMRQGHSRAEGAFLQHEYRVVWPDGTTHWVASHGKTYLEGDGPEDMHMRYIGVSMETTESRRIEDRLRISREALARAQARAHLGSWELELGETRAVWSEENYRLYYQDPSKEAPTFDEFVELVHPDDRAIFEGQMENLDGIEDAYEFESRTNPSLGPVRHLRNTMSVMRDEAGKVVRIGGTAQDITERKLAQKALREWDQLYRGVFDSMDEGFCIIQVKFDQEQRAVDYEFVEVNAAFERQTGLVNAIGRRMRELVPAHEEFWFDVYGRIALTGESARFCQEARALNRFYEVQAYRVGEPERRLVAIVFNDISVRRQTEEHIRHLNRVYAVLSGINETIIREHDSQAMMEAACRIAVDVGEFRMAWIGMIDAETKEIRPIASSGEVGSYLEIVQIDSLERGEDTGPISRCMQTGTLRVCNDIENELHRPWKGAALANGYRSLAAFPLRCEGKMVGAFCLYASELAFFTEDETRLLSAMALDISYALEVNLHEMERKKVEEELGWRTAFLQAQVDSSVDGLLAVNAAGEKLLQNVRFNEIFGIPTELAESRDDSVQLAYVAAQMKEPEAFVRIVERLYAHPSDISRDELEMKGGAVLERDSWPVVDKAGTYYGRIWMFRDITERKLQESRLRQNQKMEAIGQLTGGVAHDFNNVLGVIVGNLDLLERTIQNNESGLRRIQTAEKAAARGADLTRRLLAFSSDVELKQEAMDLNRSIHNVLELASTLGPNVTVTTRLGCEDLRILADSSSFENALLNLFVNARDAMAGNGELSLSEEVIRIGESDVPAEVDGLAEGYYACISVSDTGEGMSKATLERVFEPFFTTKPQGKGTGLGLAMVYGFVKQSGGAVRIESELGLGTTVRLYLRVAEGSISTLSEEETASDRFQPASGKVLVVDDDLDLIEIATSYLNDMGYTVYSANNGESALELVERFRDVELLITDIMMPGAMNGVELAQRVKYVLPRIKVIYSSGFAADALTENGRQHKDSSLLMKPYSRDDLFAVVQEMMQGKATRSPIGRGQQAS
jgi:signal transduction histidine kinase/CheY-like chemotaxis protein